MDRKYKSLETHSRVENCSKVLLLETGVQVVLVIRQLKSRPDEACIAYKYPE
jgi:hypothetical protein